jgi:FkbM family methyltransferase
MYYSQYGEDKLLNQIFNKNKGVCVEIGGYDGVTRSNTFFFEKLGWDCLVVEPIPFFYDKIRENRTCNALNVAVSNFKGETDFYIAKDVEELSSIVPDVERVTEKYKSNLELIKVKTDTLNSIFNQFKYSEIDFITIDVEGHEMEVLHGIDLEKFRPRILIIEDNSNTKDSKIRNYLLRFGYKLFKRTGCNEWYTFDRRFYTLMDLIELKIVYFRYFVYNSAPVSILNIYRKIKKTLN